MDKIVFNLIEFQNQIRILHWQTKSYSRHVAYGDVYDKLNKLIDKLVETYQGKYDRIKFSNSKLNLKNLEDINLNEYINSLILDLSLPDSNFLKSISSEDTDLLNIRDEILSVLHKLKYLCTLK